MYDTWISSKIVGGRLWAVCFNLLYGINALWFVVTSVLQYTNENSQFPCLLFNELLLKCFRTLAFILCKMMLN